MIKSLQFIALTICLLFSLNSLAQPFNDSCQDARVLTSLDNSCLSFNFLGATFDGRSGSCSPSDYPNAWFEFTAQGTDIEIDVMAPIDAYITVWDVNQADPCNDTLWDQELCTVNNLVLGSRLTVGKTYLVSVQFQNMGLGAYTFCINNPIPSGIPPNDDPCAAELLLADGSCYTGFNIGATSDWFNPSCTDASRASVWYRTFLTPGHSRLQAILNPTFSGQYSMFLSRFNNNSCNSYPIIVGDTLYCDNLPNPDTVIFENLSANTLYYLQIASRETGTGTFSVCLQELDDPSGCGSNDDCLGASDISVVASNPDTMCFSGCNLSALPGPQDLPGTCYYMQHPTVWHVITPDLTAAAMRIILSSDDLANPQVALYTGDTCSDLTPVLCDYSTTGFLDIALFDMIPGNKYYLAVSDLFGDEGEYDVCVDQFSLEVGCKLISSLRPVNTSFGSPISGPYQSGESVTFCYQVTAWQKGLCNWIQGIAPRFGSAWDPTSFRSNGEPVAVLQDLEAHVPGSWRWYADGAVDYNVHNPDKGYTVGSPLPGGWYFTNNDYSQTNPDFSRGDGDNCDLESGVSWEVCFALKIKDFEDCVMLDDDDASIRMETFADGEVGVYPAVSCLMDQPDLWIGQLTCCEGPSVADAIFNSCNGAIFNYNLNPTNDPLISFSWDPIVPDGVFGANPGSGTIINDQIFNFTETQQTVQYVVSISDTAGCFGPPATVSVNVQPALVVEAGLDQEVCEGRNIRLGGFPTATGGSGNYNYSWSNGSPNQPNPFYTAEADEIIVLVVTDSRGCRGTDSMLVEVVPVPRSSISASICPGDTFYFNGDAITEAGMYDDVIINGGANGCDSVVTANIVVFEEISVSDQTITANTGSNNGSISIALTGGTPPYNVSWSNGASGTVITGLKNGLYTATIRDAQNCVVTINFIVPLMSGNENIDLLNAITLQPNPLSPSNDWFIQNNSDQQIQAVSIFAMSGELINQIRPEVRTGLIQMPQNNLVAGLHLIRIETKESIVYKKLMVR